MRKSKCLRVSSIFDDALEDYMRDFRKNYGIKLKSKTQTTEILGNLIKRDGIRPSRVKRKGKSKKLIMEFDL